jgi:hypothetical protein
MDRIESVGGVAWGCAGVTLEGGLDDELGAQEGRVTEVSWALRGLGRFP